ncbi:MAG: biotin/lipoyl-binding protein, partial [Leptospiraceae bacterium]|nr:biotin/lipoyl-binding protein [Leptospiraceae bacterium]
MAETKAVQVPELGENIEKAEVTQILVEPGQNVQIDQPLIEVESDKAAVEIPSPFAGKVASIKVKAGSTVKIGEVIVELETGAQSNGNSNDSNDSAEGATSKESDSKPTASGAATSSETKQGEAAGAPRSEQTRQVLDKYDNRRVAGSPIEAPEIGDPAPAAPSV